MGRIRLFVLIVVAVAALFGACAPDTSLSGDRKPNQAPTVWLSAGPPEGSTGSYNVQLFWGGWDPDGEIAYYEYLVTDNETGVFDPADTTGAIWSRVLGNDSTFTFSADSLTESSGTQSAVFTRSHTFFIRAVDEDNRASAEPAHRSFTSRTLSPTVWIQTPRAVLGLTAAEVPPISTFEWRATDYIDDTLTSQDPESVQWALVSTANFSNSYGQTVTYLQQNPDAPEWGRWHWYRAPQDSGKFWTTPPLDYGNYVFAIRAKDEAGAVTAVLNEPLVPGTPFNVRRLRVADRNAGPTFIVTSRLIGSVITSSCNYPLTIVDVPAGVQLSFTLSACADDYGGTVSGYRYGWDILDPNDPNQWEIDYTPFVGAIATTPPRAYTFGTHTFTAEVIDNSGFCSRVEIKVNIMRFTGLRNLLVVDDYRPDGNAGAGWAASNGGLPSDGEHDAFWLDMVSNLDQFDPTRDVIQTSLEREIPLATLAEYKTLIWSVFSFVDAGANDVPNLYSYIQYRSKLPPPTTEGACAPSGGVQGKVIPNYIGLAMEAGVHVLIAGQHPVQTVRSRTASPTVRWPAIPLYEFERGNLQTGSGPRPESIQNPPGDLSFVYRELCVEVVDYGYQTQGRMRIRGSGSVNNQRYCPVSGLRTPNGLSSRDDGMRAAIPADPNFPRLELRPEVAGPTRAFAPEINSIDVEVYNPAYFRQGTACQYVPAPRPCFEPIYLLESLDTNELTYQQPIAFWTSTFGDVIAQDIEGAVAARSAVFGFPPVYFKPEQVKPAIEYIMFDEWQLPRRPISAQANLDGAAGSH